MTDQRQAQGIPDGTDLRWLHELITPHWLTEELRAGDWLISGSVTNVDLTLVPGMANSESPTAALRRLTIDYSGDAKGHRPDHCLVKIGKPGHYSLNHHEVQFYETCAERSPDLVVSCYGTWHDETAGTTVLLLADRGGSRHMTPYPVPPAIEACERAVRCLAQLHRAWWQYDRFSELPCDPWCAEKVDRMMATVFEPAVEGFLSAMGDRLSHARREIVERFTARIPDLLKQRLDNAPTMTLQHGDAHTWNFLIPDDPTKPAVMIDWQLWDVDLAVKDLSYMMALQWFPERRQRYERRLLDVYRDELTSTGDIVYTAEALTADYRFSVLREIGSPIILEAMGGPADIWWNHLERVFLAIEDWDSLAFLD